MRPALQKAFAYIGLAIGGGGTLFIVWALIVHGSLDDIESFVWFWLAGTALLAVVCIWVLRRAYGRESVQGRYQLALADLLSTLLVFSSVLYIGSYAEEGAELLVYWIVPALVFSFSYLAGVTRAARLGLTGRFRYAVGTAMALTMVGSLGAGALIAHLAVLAGVYGASAGRELAHELLGIGDTAWPRWMIYTHRVSLSALPLGLLLGLALRLVLRPGRSAVTEANKEGSQRDR